MHSNFWQWNPNLNDILVVGNICLQDNHFKGDCHLQGISIHTTLSTQRQTWDAKDNLSWTNHFIWFTMREFYQRCISFQLNCDLEIIEFCSLQGPCASMATRWSPLFPWEFLSISKGIVLNGHVFVPFDPTNVLLCSPSIYGDYGLTYESFEFWLNCVENWPYLRAELLHRKAAGMERGTANSNAWRETSA